MRYIVSTWALPMLSRCFSGPQRSVINLIIFFSCFELENVFVTSLEIFSGSILLSPCFFNSFHLPMCLCVILLYLIVGCRKHSNFLKVIVCLQRAFRTPSLYICTRSARKVSRIFVPKLLDFDQKHHSVNVAKELLDSIRDEPNLLKSVITGLRNMGARELRSKTITPLLIRRYLCANFYLKATY